MNRSELDDMLHAIGPEAAVFYDPRTGGIDAVRPFRRPEAEVRRLVDVVVRPPIVVIDTTAEVVL